MRPGFLMAYAYTCDRCDTSHDPIDDPLEAMTFEQATREALRVALGGAQ